MNALSRLCLSAILVLACTHPTHATSPERDPSPAAKHGTGSITVVPNLVVIKLRPQVQFTSGGSTLGVGSLDALCARIGATAVEPLSTVPESALRKSMRPEYHFDRMVKVRYTSGDDPALLALEIARDPNVEYAEPYYIYPLQHTPNDPRLSTQWAVTVMKLKEAWDVTTGDSTIVIGDVDTGVDWSHEDLAPSIFVNAGEYGVSGELADNGIDDDNNGKIDDWRGWDYYGNGSFQSPRPDNNPMDGTLGHGTNTSGCAAALANNGIGIAGSGYRAKILPIKASTDQTGGVGGYEGIVYAAQMGCRIINCSWGGTGSRSQALQDLINDVTNMGALVVGSSGNDPLDNDYIPHWPSSFNRVLNVGSVESSGAASNWCTYGTSVHTYAPGSGILTTRKGGGYTSPTGTSFSAPLAAGVAALVFARHPDWTPDQVATQIRVTSDPFTTSGGSKRYGRLNAFRAVSENANLDEIPGVRVRSFTYLFPGGGDAFTESGQTARVTMEIENLLAPTSADATVTVDLDDPSITTSATVFPIGVLGTFERDILEFEIVLSDNPRVSEGYLPVRLRVEDGEYLDYLVGRVPIYLDDAWHTSLNFGAPYFTSIDAVSNSVVWANAHVQNQDVMVRTVNGGSSWANAGASGYPSGAGVYTVCGISTTQALAGTGPSTGAAAVYRTTNGGSNWTPTAVSTITGFVNWIHMFDTQNGILQGDPRNNSWGIATTSDAGVTWTKIDQAPSSTGSEAGWNNSYAAVGDHLWFGTNSSKIYRSTDRGLSWTSHATPSQHSVDMAFADQQRGMIRFTTQTNQGGSNALAVTEDGGVTWTLLSSITVTTGGGIEVEPDGKRFWFMQDENAWVTTDLGKTWTVQATPGAFGLIGCSTSSVGAGTTTVYAAGIDIFKFNSTFDPFNTTTVSSVSAPAEFRFDQVYPNPVSSVSRGGVTVGFTLVADAMAQLTIHDNLGRIVREGIAGTLAAGSHSVNLDVSGLATGSYHLRLRAGEHTAIAPLQVIH
ncbi:MAG: S8 family serine peptidase [Bacteroidota bacterium]|jgi:subtilisin family serine protease|nr:S8 family serine peptidase [Bacteroidota bacterium]